MLLKFLSSIAGDRDNLTQSREQFHKKEESSLRMLLSIYRESQSEICPNKIPPREKFAGTHFRKANKIKKLKASG